MQDTDYEAAITDTLGKLGAISKEISRLEIEAAKLKQFFAATLNMLPDDKRSEYLALFRELGEQASASEMSLKRAIHHVLLEAHPNYLTVASVRDRLQDKGFDFTEYKSNPLASVSTTLRRARPEEIESARIEGVRAYRLSETYVRRIRKLARKLK
jgi:hypothetical protein